MGDLNLAVLDFLFGRIVDNRDRLCSVLPEQYVNLQYLQEKRYKEDGVSLESLCLTFSCTEDALPEY